MLGVDGMFWSKKRGNMFGLGVIYMGLGERRVFYGWVLGLIKERGLNVFVLSLCLF